MDFLTKLLKIKKTKKPKKLKEYSIQKIIGKSNLYIYIYVYTMFY